MSQVGYGGSDVVTIPSLGTQIGDAATDTLGFYGTSAVSQRTNTIQAASVVSVSSNITIAASLTAWIVEVTATLTGLGIWKGS